MATSCNRRETTLTLTIEYPDATPSVIEDTIAAPVEQQVRDVEGLLAMTSISGAERFVLYVQGRSSIDAAVFTTLVKNRFQLAVPILPDMAKVGNVVDVSGKPIPPLPEIREVDEQYVDLDREKISKLGIPLQTIRDEIKKAKKLGLPRGDVTIELAGGKKVHLSDFAKIRMVHEPNYRVHRFPSTNK
jgi:multidrug efflux pump subunit AcrB